MRRLLPFLLAVVAVAWFVGSPLSAAQAPQTRGQIQTSDQTETHEGKVVSVTGNKLVMTMKGSDKEHMHTIAQDAKIMLNGKQSTADELKPGMRIKVTSPKNDKTMVVKIEGFTERR
jgi:hypothetical protein